MGYLIIDYYGEVKESTKTIQEAYKKIERYAPGTYYIAELKKIIENDVED